MTEQTTYTAQGLPIYSYPNPHLHTFCICLYVRGGSLYESPEENGLTHFFEHIVFKNINRQMNGELFRTLDCLGLDFNACTYREMIQFTITGAPQHFREAAGIIARIFCPVDVPDKDIQLERKRILAEIREADEKKELDYLNQKEVWHGTSLAQTITGKKKILKSAGCEELRKMQYRLLSLDNCFFYLTGAVTGTDIASLARQMSAYALPDLGLRHDNSAPLPEDFCQRPKTLHVKKGDASELGFSFDFRSGSHTEAARSLLYDLLFCGDNSRIFQELSEKTGYIYSFDSHLEEYTNGGTIYLSFEIAPSRMVKAAGKVIDILRQLGRGEGICLDYVLPQYVDNAGAQLDDAESLNWIMAYERHFLGQTWTSLEERSAFYNRVTPEDIQKLACEIFRPENLTLCCKGKKKNLPKKLDDAVFPAFV